MKESGSRIKSTEQENRYGRMGIPMMATGKMANELVGASMCGQMVLVMKGAGKTESG